MQIYKTDAAVKRVMHYELCSDTEHSVTQQHETWIAEFNVFTYFFIKLYALLFSIKFPCTLLQKTYILAKFSPWTNH